MIEIGDRVTLKYKKEDYPMISEPIMAEGDTDEKWERFIHGSVVFIFKPGNSYTIRHDSGIASRVARGQFTSDKNYD